MLHSLPAPISTFINHLLKQNMGQQGLSDFSGQTIQIQWGENGPFFWVLEIMSDGSLSSPRNFDQANKPVSDVCIILPHDFPLLLADRAALFSKIHLSGSAQLAEALGAVFKNISWDVEDDLAQLFGNSILGDIAARRFYQISSELAHEKQKIGEKLLENLVEYWVNESKLLVHHKALEHFCENVDHLRDHLARLEKRLDYL